MPGLDRTWAARRSGSAQWHLRSLPLLAPIVTFLSSCNKLFCKSRPKRQLPPIYIQLGEHNTSIPSSVSPLLCYNPFLSVPSLGLSPFSTIWTQMGSWEMVYLPQMKTWGISCFLQYSFLPLIIPLHFHSHIALCYCSVISSVMPLWCLEENRTREDGSDKLEWHLNFLQFCMFSETELGKLPAQSRASSPSAFPHCHPNITSIFSLETRRFSAKKHLRWWFFCCSEAKRSLWHVQIQGGRLYCFNCFFTRSALAAHLLHPCRKGMAEDSSCQNITCLFHQRWWKHGCAQPEQGWGSF